METISSASGSTRGASGGIAGVIEYGSTVSECLVKATLKGAFVGGLCSFTSGKIIDSYFIGSIINDQTNAYYSLGVLVGQAYDYTDIQNCYSVSEISEQGISYSDVGGLIGSFYGTISVINSFSEQFLKLLH
ncbi:hypothetical protein SAMN05446037_1007135 [Anaerovirgula multivorans]|uniref:GLUG domain-containing protein n=1 Tax=Anaerovirgula multivorans TaxID=312168 RepID=A0A239DEH6_9FIRM|nr:GLUG motif-containing protein [Anaerovirgula multivorans]SNS30727.1 hypothetical protein SAMN05446037_1007135 [Anaerovirgula multivorans]